MATGSVGYVRTAERCRRCLLPLAQRRHYRLDSANTVLVLAQYRADGAGIASALVDRPAAAQFPDLRRDLDRQRSHRLYRQRVRAASRRLLGRSYASASTTSSMASIRSRSAGASMCFSCCWRSAWFGCSHHARAAQAGSARSIFSSCCRSCRSFCCSALPCSDCPTSRPRFGAACSLRWWSRGRHRVLVADRHHARARPPLENAGGAAVLGHLHRVRARRAADHGAVHGERDAAVVRAGGMVTGQIAARLDRRRDVRGGLYGGSRACRPAGDSARPIRGRAGARARLLADDGPDHPAAGAAHDHPEYRQQHHRAVQGYDAGLHRRHFRFPAHHRGRAHRSQMGDAGDHRHRLCLRRACSISSAAG